MKKPARLALGLAAAAAVVACTVNLSFTYSKTGTVVAFTGASVNQALPIDLSTQKEVQDHKGNVEDLTLDSLVATVSAVNAGNNVTSISGKLTLRPDGATDGSQDVLVGTLTNFAITQNSSVTLQGSPALDALVLSTIKGSGKATAYVVGTATGSSTPVTGNFTLDLALHLSMAYSP
jgi:flagellar hook assembly protein FlgD